MLSPSLAALFSVLITLGLALPLGPSLSTSKEILERAPEPMEPIITRSGESGKGGIVIPDTIHEKPQGGTVIATGPGINRAHTIRSDRIITGSGESGKGGIVIPDTAHEKPQGGTVIATGPGRDTGSSDTKNMKAYGGTVISIGPGDKINVKPPR